MVALKPFRHLSVLRGESYKFKAGDTVEAPAHLIERWERAGLIGEKPATTKSAAARGKEK